MSKSLYQINEELLYIVTELTEGEATPELEESLKITREQLETKAIGYDHIIKFLNSQVELADREISRIEAFKENKNKQIEKLEGALLQAVLLFGKEDKLSPAKIAEGKIPVKRLEFGTLRLSTRRSQSVEIVNEPVINDKYKLVNLTVKDLTVEKAEELKKLLLEKQIGEIDAPSRIMKTPIAEDIKKGEIVEGAILQTNYGLTIK